jgi:hypothetical protein
MIAYFLTATTDFIPRGPCGVEPVMMRARRDTENAISSPISSDCPFCLKPFSTALGSAGKKVADGGCDLGCVRLQCEMAGVQKADDPVWDVPFERLCARWQKERVVLAPNR